MLERYREGMTPELCLLEAVGRFPQQHSDIAFFKGGRIYEPLLIEKLR